MDTIPGAFPAIAPASNGTHLPRVASDLISVRQSLQSRRTSFVKDLMDKLALLTGAYMFLAYLYDCSVLMLILRGAIHWNLTMPYPWQDLPVSRVVLSTITLQSLFITNVSCALLHYLRDIPPPEANGFVYGHYSVQVIGEKQITDKTWLYILDVVIFFSQMLIYGSLFHVNEIQSNSSDREHDGTLGNTVAMRINLINSINAKFVTISELLRADAADNERVQRFGEAIRGPGGLLDDGSTVEYGATDRTDRSV